MRGLEAHAMNVGEMLNRDMDEENNENMQACASDKERRGGGMMSKHAWARAWLTYERQQR